MRPTTQNEKHRLELERQIKEYQAQGGKIKQCPPQQCAEVLNDADWKKNKNSFTITHK